jgi:enterochelin esterase-like enzyme
MILKKSRLKFRLTASLLAATLFSVASSPLWSQTTPTGLFHVKISPSLPGPVSGRLLVFMKQGHGDKSIDPQQFSPEDFDPEKVWVAAKEIHDVSPGDSVELNANDEAFPHAFFQAPAGEWEAQAVLDVDHTYNYGGRQVADWQSGVVSLSARASATELTLTEHPAESPQVAALKTTLASLKPDVAQRVEIPSQSLQNFWGKPTAIRAWVILPPNYEANRKQVYPTVYWTSGFTGDMQAALAKGLSLRKRMDEGKMPPMVWVMLDHSVPQGTQEFADSVNNGPWGTALTTEFIPQLERRYRLDARRDARFVTGHSSGGWASLQLEINYPNVFGGTWSTSPDPSDFHNFSGVDLYAPNTNMYHRADGKPTPVWREHARIVATIEQFARLEAVLGPYGGQFSSFDWVFSPKGPSGAPEPMFDRITGAVHPEVVQYWHDHYDMAYIAEKYWPSRGALLKGRIHLYVGTEDSFYLDGPAHLLEARLKKLGADPHFTYIPDRTHFDLYWDGDDRAALFDQIAAQMYSVAKPHEKWQRQSSTQVK